MNPLEWARTNLLDFTTCTNPDYRPKLDAQHEAQVGALTVTAVNPTVIVGGAMNLTVNLSNSAPSLADALNLSAAANGAVFGPSTTGSLAAANSDSFTIANGFNSAALSAGSYLGTVRCRRDLPLRPHVDWFRLRVRCVARRSADQSRARTQRHRTPASRYLECGDLSPLFPPARAPCTHGRWLFCAAANAVTCLTERETTKYTNHTKENQAIRQKYREQKYQSHLACF